MRWGPPWGPLTFVVSSIYRLEEIQQPFLVLELVEGEDLSERLRRGPLTLEEVLDVARHVADELDTDPASVREERVLPAAVCGRRGTKLWPPGGSRFWRPRANGRSVQSTSSDAALWQAEHGHRYC